MEGVGFPAPDSFIATDLPKHCTPRSVFRDGWCPSPARQFIQEPPKEPLTRLPFLINNIFIIKKQLRSLRPGTIDPASFTLIPRSRGQRVSLTVLVRYRSRNHPFPWVENTTPSQCTTNHYYSPQTSSTDKISLSWSRTVTGSAQLHRCSQSNKYPVSHSARRLQVGNQPFRSPLLRPSLLLSIPSPTNMLKFGELPLPKEILGSPQRVPPSLIKNNFILGGEAAPFGIQRISHFACLLCLSRLTAAFLALRADGSTDRPFKFFLTKIIYL